MAFADSPTPLSQHAIYPLDQTKNFHTIRLGRHPFYVRSWGPKRIKKLERFTLLVVLVALLYTAAKILLLRPSGLYPKRQGSPGEDDTDWQGSLPADHLPVATPAAVEHASSCGDPATMSAAAAAAAADVDADRGQAIISHLSYNCQLSNVT